MSISSQTNFVNRLSHEQKQVIRWYTTEQYKTFNEALRSGKITTEFAEKYNTLKEIFEAIPPLEEPLLVYRGRMSSKIEEMDRAFASTSLSKRIALNFTSSSCCLLYITVSPGSKVLPVFNLSDQSD